MASHHPIALQTLYASLIDAARGQATIALQSTGTVVRKTVKGREYVYWRSYVAGGRRTDEYLGAFIDPRTVQEVEERLLNSREAKHRADSVKTLRLAGFAVADNSSALTVASLFNAGIFRQGGVLVGSHAFNALLNSLSVKLSANYRTDNIDVGARDQISLAVPDDNSCFDVLSDAGVPFVEEPALDHRRSTGSFKQRGAVLPVDLLVPGTEAYETKPLPGLKAHATGLPFFDYLMGKADLGFVLGRDHIVPVQLPDPARFGLHKLIVSALRPNEIGVKVKKDLDQARVMLDAVLAHNDTWVSEAIDALPPATYGRIAQAARRVLDDNEDLSDIVLDTFESLSTIAQ